MPNHVVLTICGEEYPFVAEEAPAYMQRVASYVHDKMSDILTNSTMSRTNAAILTAVNITDELFKCQDAGAQIRSQIKGYLDEAAKAQAEVSELKRENFRLQKQIEHLNKELAKNG